jgi:hypothetical protein
MGVAQGTVPAHRFLSAWTRARILREPERESGYIDVLALADEV